MEDDRLPYRVTRGGAAYDGINRLPVSVLLADVRSAYNVGAFFRTAEAVRCEHFTSPASRRRRRIAAWRKPRWAPSSAWRGASWRIRSRSSIGLSDAGVRIARDRDVAHRGRSVRLVAVVPASASSSATKSMACRRAPRTCDGSGAHPDAGLQAVVECRHRRRCCPLRALATIPRTPCAASLARPSLFFVPSSVARLLPARPLLHHCLARLHGGTADMKPHHRMSVGGDLSSPTRGARPCRFRSTIARNTRSMASMRSSVHSCFTRWTTTTTASSAGVSGAATANRSVDHDWNHNGVLSGAELRHGLPPVVVHTALGRRQSCERPRFVRSATRCCSRGGTAITTVASRATSGATGRRSIGSTGITTT